MQTYNEFIILIFLLFGCLLGQNAGRNQNTKRTYTSTNFWDNVIGFWGFGLGIWDIRQQYPNSSLFSSPPTMGTFNLGGKYTYWSHNDFVAVNFASQLQLAIRLTTPMDYYVGIPVYAMGNIGAGSTPYNESVAGAGLGIGGRIAYINFNYGNSNTSFNSTLSQAYMTPFVVGELNLFSYSFRLFVDVLPFPIKFKVDPRTEIDATIGSVQLEMDFFIK